MAPLKIHRTFVLIFLFAFHGPGLAQPAVTSPETAFDFWVGEWEVSWIGEDSSRVTGTNSIKKILDDKVVQENFLDPSRNFKGTSISVYDPQARVWHQAWADNSGGFYALIGRVEGAERIFEMIENDSGGARYRMIFSDITDTEFNWRWQGIREGWKDWKTVWEIHYQRKR